MNVEYLSTEHNKCATNINSFATDFPIIKAVYKDKSDVM